MFTIKSNIPQFAKRMEKFNKNLHLGSIKTVQDVTKVGKRYAKTIVAHKKGMHGGIAGSIYRRTFNNKTQGSIISATPKDSPKNFPYHMWVNEDIKSIRLPKRLNRNGSWPSSKQREASPSYWTSARTYRSTRNSGAPGYMNETFKYLNKVFPQKLVKQINKAVRL